MIVVTGSTGHVGRLVAEELAALGERDASTRPRSVAGAAVARSRGGAGRLRRPGVAAGCAPGGRPGLHGVPARGARNAEVELHQSFVDAAAEAGVGQLVYLSFVNAGPDAIFLHTRGHTARRRRCSATRAFQWTSIRNGMYADDVLGWFDEDDLARETGGDGRMSFSYRPEIAKVIAHVLTTREHEEKIYNVTTPESVSLSELAEIADRSDRQAASLRAGRRGRVGGEVASDRQDGLGARRRLHHLRSAPSRRSSTWSLTTTAG